MIDLKKPIRFKNTICRMNKILRVSPGWAAIMVEYVSWNSRIAEAAVAVYSLAEFDETFENEIEVMADESLRKPREWFCNLHPMRDEAPWLAGYETARDADATGISPRGERIRVIEWPADAPLPDLPP